MKIVTNESKMKYRSFHCVFLLIIVLLQSVSANVELKQKEEECYITEDGTSICGEENNNDDELLNDTTTTTNNTEEESSNCKNEHNDCQMWSDSGECTANPTYMLRSCRLSCDTCDLDGAKMNDRIKYNQRLHHVNGDETLLEDTHGKLQKYGGDDPTESAAVQQVVADMSDYMTTVVFADAKKYKDVMHSCKNRHELCAYWKTIGECESNTNFMQKQCAVACHSCHVLDFKHRCPVDETIPMALTQPDDLDNMFQRVLTLEKYGPQPLSMPNPPSNATTDIQDGDIQDGAWLVVLNNFLTPEECDRLIELGGHQGYKQSADVGQKKFDGTYDSNVNSGRTSNNAWCMGACYNDEISQRVHAKMEDVLGIPRANYEYLQVLRYEVGQFYNTHHDYIGHHVDRQPGVRTLTLYLYLNDVEEGGGTEFPTMGLEVTPRKGKAVLWPSVLNQDPNAKDIRTEHGALPVKKGIKYGANAWIHQRDFKEALDRKCV